MLRSNLFTKLILGVVILILIGISAVPATVSAEHKWHRSIEIGDTFVYMAYDSPGHPIPRCPGLSNRPHLNVNVKRDKRDRDTEALLRLHISIPDNKGKIWIYEGVSKKCIGTNNMSKEIHKIFKKVKVSMSQSGKVVKWILKTSARMLAFIIFKR